MIDFRSTWSERWQRAEARPLSKVRYDSSTTNRYMTWDAMRFAGSRHSYAGSTHSGANRRRPFTPDRRASIETLSSTCGVIFSADRRVRRWPIYTPIGLDWH
jgi:hypothetical protein